MITTTIIERRFVGNGVAVAFPVDIEGIPDAPAGADHLAVSVLDAAGDERALHYGADFSYTATTVNGFSKSIVVTLSGPLPVGETLIVKRTTPIVSISSYPEDKTPSRQVERDIDNTIKIMQEGRVAIDGIAAAIPPIHEDLASLHAVDDNLAKAIAAEATTRAEADSNLSAAIDIKADKEYVDSELGKKATIDALRNLEKTVDTKAPKTLATQHARGLMSASDKEKLDDIGIATESHLGLVKPDGISTTIDSDGTLHAAGGGGGTADHRALAGREAERQHPDTAITRGSGPENVHDAIDAIERNAKAMAEALERKAPIADPEFSGTVSIGGNAVASMAFVDDAPADGRAYVRKNKTWAQDRSAFPLMIGQVTPYFGAVDDKSAFEPNFLYADGRAVSREQYPELFAAYGTIYGDGDGATTFTLPDMRGMFMRGMDEGRGLDPGRLLGVHQGDAIRNITGTGHTPKRFGEVGGYFTGAFTPINGSISYNATGFDVTGMKYEFDASLVVPTAHENRPVNMACHWFIVAQSPAVASSSDFTAAINAVNSTAQAAANAVRAELRNPQVLHIQERQPNGTHGGTFTAGAWRTRNLNTVIRNTMPGADFDNTEIVLPAGLYEVQAFVTSYAVFDNILALMDSNDAVLLHSRNAMNLNTYAYPLPSILQGLLELSQPTACRLTHRCATSRANDGFGRAASLGLPEIYSDILIKRIR